MILPVWSLMRNMPSSKICMKTAKTILDGKVPSSLFATGTSEAVEEHCKKLIERCAPDGGYYLAPGAVIENT